MDISLLLPPRMTRQALMMAGASPPRLGRLIDGAAGNSFFKAGLGPDFHCPARQQKAHSIKCCG
jgi:hypothetical protein